MQLNPNGFFAKYFIFPLAADKESWQLPRSFCQLFWHNVAALVSWLGVLMLAVSPFVTAISAITGGALKDASAVLSFLAHLGVGVVFIICAMLVSVAFALLITLLGSAITKYKNVRYMATVRKRNVENPDGIRPTESMYGEDEHTPSKFIGFITNTSTYTRNIYRRVKDKTCPLVEWS